MRAAGGGSIARVDDPIEALIANLKIPFHGLNLVNPVEAERAIMDVKKVMRVLQRLGLIDSGRVGDYNQRANELVFSLGDKQMWVDLPLHVRDDDLTP